MDGFELKDITVSACDFKYLSLCGNTKVQKCTFADVNCNELSLSGTLAFLGSTLDIDGPFVIDPGSHIEINHCRLTESARKQLENARALGIDITLKSVDVIESETVLSVTAEPLSPGRRFINRLMALLRKEGHAEFAVYLYKLRSRTPGDDPQFAKALEVLQRRGILMQKSSMVLMTEDGMAHMYSHRLYGRPGYNSHEGYWDPIVRQLDVILAPGCS